jgi:hypothetical protein
MGPQEAALYHAEMADRTSVSRLQKEMKKSKDWSMLTYPEQKILMDEKKQELQQKRYVKRNCNNLCDNLNTNILNRELRGYTKRNIKAELTAMLDEFKEEDKEFVAKQEFLGVRDPNSEVFWVEDDEYTNEELNATQQDFHDESIEKDLTLQTAILDCFSGDRQIFDAKKRHLNAKEVKSTLMATEARKRYTNSFSA